MEKHHRTIDWHYDITMEPIMMTEVLLKDKYINKYIFISYTLAGNDIKSLHSRI